MSLKTVSAVMAIVIGIIASCTDEPIIAWFLVLPFILAFLGEIFDRVPNGGDYVE